MDLSKAKVGDKFTAEFTVINVLNTYIVTKPTGTEDRYKFYKTNEVLTLDTPIAVGFKFGGPSLTWEIVHIQEDVAFCMSRHGIGSIDSPSGYHISLIKKWLDEGTYVAKNS